MSIENFTQPLVEILNHSLVSPGRSLNCTIIINPVAGGFTISKKRKKIIKILNEYSNKAKENPKRELAKDVNAVFTESKGSCAKITEEIINQAQRDPFPFYLIICAGGDGTHSEVLFSLYGAPAHVRSNMAVLRLPMGTGNDGADSANMDDALELLIKPVHVKYERAVQLITSHNGKAYEKGPYLAFNILSAGLDAFVTHMTNKMKGKMPGDSYKLWLDIAALFYDRFYKVDYIDVRALDHNNNVIDSFNEKLLLLAMGASGRRTYGSNQKILPDERNFCCINQMPVYRKLFIKGQVKNGLHTTNPEVRIFSAHRVEFSARHPILAQMDGETILLEKDDFPSALELTAPVIPLLELVPNMTF